MAENEIQDNQPLRAISHLPKFDGTNHREWNFEIDLVFQHHDLKELVLGSEVLPEEVTIPFIPYPLCKHLIVQLHRSDNTSFSKCSP